MLHENIYANIPDFLPGEFMETLVSSGKVRIERIVSSGHCTPEGEWYDQHLDEWVLVLAGSAGLIFEGKTGEIVLKTGDYVMIPAHCRHRVAWTDSSEKTVWLAVHIER